MGVSNGQVTRVQKQEEPKISDQRGVGSADALKKVVFVHIDRSNHGLAHRYEVEMVRRAHHPILFSSVDGVGNTHDSESYAVGHSPLRHQKYPVSDPIAELARRLRTKDDLDVFVFTCLDPSAFRPPTLDKC